MSFSLLQELPAALKQQKLLVEDLDDKYHAARIAALHTIEDVEKELRYWRKLETHAAIPEDARPNSENDFDLQFFAR